MVRSLENKVALVTGGSSGIGRASALLFAREGAKVVVADINIDGGEETVKMIGKTSGESIFVRTDVTSATQVEALVNKSVETYGRLDCAHNNAGVEESPARTTADCDEKDWDRITGINLKGVWLCMKYEIPQMLRQGSGAIVNTSSIFGLVGLAKRPAYAASKHGVIGITKVAALDYASAGIRINAVCPGVIDTPMVKRLWANSPGTKQQTTNQPTGRLGTAEEVAEAVVWLCSDAASYVTGYSMSVDGGWAAG